MEHFDTKEDLKYSKIYAAVAWPGKRPGFVAVVGKLKEHPFSMVVLREHEEADLRTLVRTCSALDYFFKPEQFLGEPKNDAAQLFLREVNKEHKAHPKVGDRTSVLRRSRLLDLKEFFAYVYPALKELLKTKRLSLGDARLLRDYLLAPQESDLAELQLGDYPSIEALAMAALALDERRQGKRFTHVCNDYRRI
jgi:hypothetical protein